MRAVARSRRRATPESQETRRIEPARPVVGRGRGALGSYGGRRYGRIGPTAGLKRPVPELFMRTSARIARTPCNTLVGSTAGRRRMRRCEDMLLGFVNRVDLNHHQLLREPSSLAERSAQAKSWTTSGTDGPKGPRRVRFTSRPSRGSFRDDPCIAPEFATSRPEARAAQHGCARPGGDDANSNAGTADRTNSRY